MEMSGIPRRRVGTPMKEIPDIFIPPTQSGKVGVTRRRNENSGMTMEGDDEGDGGGGD